MKEWAGNSGIVGDKAVIEVGKAKKGMYFLDFSRGRSGSDAIEFHKIHSKVLDLRDIKLAFLKFQIEVKLSHSLEDAMASFGMCC